MGEDTFDIFFLLQNDKIYYTLSASKMSSTRYYNTKESQFHKKLFLIPRPKLYSNSTFAEVFTGFKYIHPLLSIESH